VNIIIRRKEQTIEEFFAENQTYSFLAFHRLLIPSSSTPQKGKLIKKLFLLTAHSHKQTKNQTPNLLTQFL
jgi:hypothetical protein